MYIEFFSFFYEDSKDIIKNRELKFGPETNFYRKAPQFRNSLCLYIDSPHPNPVIFNNFFLEKETFVTVIYRKKIPVDSIGLNKS